MANKVTFDASFSADTSNAEASVKRYTESIKAANATIKQAERDAKESYQSQMLAAKAAGASTEQLSAISRKYAQDMLAVRNTAKEMGAQLVTSNRDVITSEQAKAQAIALTQRALFAQAEAARALEQAQSHQSHEAVSGVQATSAAIRGIEGSGGIRAIENFLSKTLGLGPAMQAIFPLVGGAMFAKMLFDIGEKAYEVGSKATHASELIRTAFDEQHSKALVTIDDLTVQGDKLQDNIDKLSGHPNNGLQTALDEARKYADKLLESLQADRKELEALLKQNSVGAFGSLLSGVAATGTQEKQILLDQSGLSKAASTANADFNRAAAGAKSLDEIKVLGQKRDQAIRDSVQRTIDTYHREAQRLRDEQSQNEQARLAQAQYAATQGHGAGAFLSPIDNGAKIANAEGVAGRLQDSLVQMAAESRVSDLTEKDGAAKQNKENSTQAGEAARKAAAAARAAAAEQRKQWDDQHAAWAAETKRSAGDDYIFWAAKSASVAIGSENFNEARKKANEAAKKLREEHDKGQDEANKLTEKNRAELLKGVNAVLEPGVKADSKGILDQQTALQALVAAQRESTYQQALAQAQLDASTNAITKYDGAVLLQTLHSAEYAAKLQDLKEKIAAVQAGPEHDAQVTNLTRQMNDVASQSIISAMQDNAAVAAQTWEGALRNANAAWVNDSRDSAKQIKDVYQSLMGGLNSNLVEAMSGGKTHFKSVFQGVAKQVAGFGLQRAESGLLGAFGLKKADGSKGNPLHVTWDGMAPGSTGSSVIAGSSIGGAATGFLKTALGFLPGGQLLGGLFGGGRATGGNVMAGTTYLTGEHGPELVTMGRSGSVTPNNKLRDAFGGGDVHVHVDARGSTDPAQVRYQARVGAMEGHAAATRMYGDQQQDAKRRVPGSR